MSNPMNAALVCALATLVLVAGLCKWLGPRGWMDTPNGRKQHRLPTPRVGGIALLLVLAGAKLAGWLWLGLSPLEWTVVGGMALVGLMDDRFDLRARWKALAGLAFALPLAGVQTWAALNLGRNITLFGLDIPDHALVIFPLMTMWYWAIPHAFNLIDGLNGLSLGFSCLLLGALSLGPEAQLGAGAGPLWGGLAALLLLNYPRARHFMGDAGSLSLGALFAILVMDRALPFHRGLAMWLMAYPILDVTTVVAIRWFTKRPLGQADRNHMHHWLMDRLGGRAWLVAPLLLFLAALPMTRDLSYAWAKPLSMVGLLVLVMLSIRVFLERAVLQPEAKAEAQRPPVEPLRPYLADPSGPNRVA